MLCHSTESPFYEDGCIQSLLWWSEWPEAQFLGTSYKTQSQRSQIGTKWELFFPSLHSVRCRVHHLPQQTHLRFIDLNPKAFQWKMFMMIRYISIAQLKSVSKPHSFSLFYSASILNFKQLNTPSVRLISLNLLLHQTIRTETQSYYWLITKIMDWEINFLKKHFNDQNDQNKTIPIFSVLGSHE